MGLSDQRRTAQGRADKSRGTINENLSRLMGQYEDVQGRTDVTKEDLFGREMRSIADKAMASSNNTKNALSRALSAGGGDVTGEASGQMRKADSQAMDIISRSEDVYDDKTRQYIDTQENKAMNLLGQALNTETQLYGADQNQANMMQQLKIQKEQAKKQMWFDLAGSLAEATGNALG